jgi:biopolymer transport protein ExbD
MRRSNPAREHNTIKLNMTPMIDVVFSLLSFFIMTLKIVAPEGDFDVKMPFGPSSPSEQINLTEPIRVVLTSNANGELVNISVGNVSFHDNFASLRKFVYDAVHADNIPISDSIEVELAHDENLRYEFMIDAITAVSGYVKDGKTFTLVDKIRFAPRQNKGGI